MVALAFLLALVPVRNSDFWLHLASGRSLVEGQDPSFSYLQEPAAYQPGWLFDLLVYEGFVHCGEDCLIVLKACLAGSLALLLFFTGRAGGPFWLSAAATMLTLVAMAPWLSFRPVVVSFCFFALTFYLLTQAERGAKISRVALLLTAIFGLWANADQWFVLGLLLVGCWYVQQLFSGRADAVRHRGSMAALLLVCSLGGCLLNPRHVFVFAPRGEWFFSPVAIQLGQDAALRGELLAPWRQTYLSAHALLNGPGLAFWLLVTCGLISFLLQRGNLSRRGLAWTIFFALSLVQTQVIPFFAMVAGVTVSLNLASWLAGRQTRRWTLSWARGSVLLLGLTLCAVAWIGLFQSSVLEARSVRVDADPELPRVAQSLASWRAQGHLGKGNAFHLSPEAANQLAWFCPGEKTFLTSSLGLSRAEAAEYVAIRQGLLAGRNATDEWRGLLRKHHINHVIVYSNDAVQAETVVGQLLRRPREWPLLYMQGGVAIFGWRDPLGANSAHSFAHIEKSLEQLAYTAGETEPAPVQGPQREPQEFHWWDAFWKQRSVRTPDLRAATMALAAYEALGPQRAARNLMVWSVCASASLVAEECCPAVISPALASVDLRRRLFLFGQDDGPPEALYLAIRAARNAIVANPDDATAYFALGEAYFRLHTGTRERLWSGVFLGLGRIRTIQAITAYHHALHLNPDLAPAHQHLADLFISMDYKDLALKHLREFMRSVRVQARRTSASPGILEKLLAKPERLERNLAREVEQLTDRFDINSANLKVLDRANLAGRMGLPEKALTILLDSDVAAFGTEGMDLELKLLLLTGQAEKVRLWMTGEHESILRAYHWNKIQLHAGLGNYASADQEMANMDRLQVLNRHDITLRAAGGLLFGQGVLAAGRQGLFQKVPARVFLFTGALPRGTYRLLPDENEVAVGMWTVAQGLGQEAHHLVLRGLLALEAGRLEQARRQFAEALVFLNSAAAAPFAAVPEAVAARLIAERFIKLLSPRPVPMTQVAQSSFSRP